MTGAECWPLWQKLPIRYQFTAKDYAIAGYGNITVRGKRKNTYVNGNPIFGDQMGYSMVSTGCVIRFHDDSKASEGIAASREVGGKTQRSLPSTYKLSGSESVVGVGSPNKGRVILRELTTHRATPTFTTLTKASDIRSLSPHQRKMTLLEKSNSAYKSDHAMPSPSPYKLISSSDSYGNKCNKSSSLTDAMFNSQQYIGDSESLMSPGDKRHIKILRHAANQDDITDWQALRRVTENGTRTVHGTLINPPLSLTCSGASVTLRSVGNKKDQQMGRDDDMKWAKKSSKSINHDVKTTKLKQLKRSQTVGDLEIPKSNHKPLSPMGHANSYIKRMKRSVSVAKLKLNNVESITSSMNTSPHTPNSGREFTFVNPEKPKVRHLLINADPKCSVSPASDDGFCISLPVSPIPSIAASQTRKSGIVRRDEKNVPPTENKILIGDMLIRRIKLHQRDSLNLKEKLESMKLSEQETETRYVQTRIGDETKPSPTKHTATKREVEKPNQTDEGDAVSDNPIAPEELICSSKPIHRLPSAKEMEEIS